MPPGQHKVALAFPLFEHPQALVGKNPVLEVDAGHELLAEVHHAFHLADFVGHVFSDVLDRRVEHGTLVRVAVDNGHGGFHGAVAGADGLTLLNFEFHLVAGVLQ